MDGHHHHHGDGHHHHHHEADQEASIKGAAREAAFIAGFRAAPDKAAFLDLCGIPRERAGGLKLVEVRIEDAFSVGTVSPGFGGGDLIHHPLPGAMVTATAGLRFVYVSLSEKVELGLAAL